MGWFTRKSPEAAALEQEWAEATKTAKATPHYAAKVRMENAATAYRQQAASDKAAKQRK